LDQIQNEDTAAVEMGSDFDNDNSLEDEAFDNIDDAAVPDILPVDTERGAVQDAVQGTTQERRSQDLAHQLQLPSIQLTPLNEFNRSQPLFSWAFPTLFPYGQGDFIHERLRSVNLHDYIEHAMRWQDGRFAKHPLFRFVAFNFMMRSQVQSHSKFLAHRRQVHQEPITKAQLVEAFTNDNNPEAQSLLNSISRYAAPLKGTRLFWLQKRKELEALTKCLSCPSVFMTFSPADLHRESLYRHMPDFDLWKEDPRMLE
jgi:hypothetical protein